jgi:ADP-heptose:LPS heptosyltransferase
VRHSRALLICAGGGIGDTLLASMVAGALKSTYDTVDALTTAGHVDVLTRNPYVSDVLVDRGSLLELAGDLRQRDYDAAVVTWATTRTALLPWLARIPTRVGQSRRTYSMLFTHQVPVVTEEGDTKTHWSSVLLRYARALQCETSDERPLFPIAAEETIAADTLLSSVGAGDSFALLHATCSWSTKRPVWPLEGWLAGADALQQRFGWPVLTCGSPADAPIARALSEKLRTPTIAGLTTLGTFAAAARRARYIVSMHSGPMHIAAAVGAPTVGVFPLQVDFPDRWRPLGPRVALVRARYPCPKGDLIETCPGYACVRELDSRDIVAAAERALRPEGSPSTPESTINDL